jgi:hypothetical protein
VRKKVEKKVDKSRQKASPVKTVKKPGSPARLARGKRIVTVYFLNEADLRRVKTAAKTVGVGFTVFIREAALDRAMAR